MLRPAADGDGADFCCKDARGNVIAFLATAERLWLIMYTLHGGTMRFEQRERSETDAPFFNLRGKRLREGRSGFLAEFAVLCIFLNKDSNLFTKYTDFRNIQINLCVFGGYFQPAY